MPKWVCLYAFQFLMICTYLTYGQRPPLYFKIDKIAKEVNGKVGISILNIEDRDTINYNGNSYCVMQSVFKFPIAITLLNGVDKGKIDLNKKIHINKNEMTADTWSPLRDKYPEGNVDVSIGDLLKYMVSNSDDIACDVILKTLGGPKNVEDYMRNIGIKEIAMAASEAEMHAGWNIQYMNWCTPRAMVHLLDIFYKKKILSKKSNELLYTLMAETTTGPKRLKGLLPAGTKVAHRTGTSNTNSKGMTPATNDVGIISLPNGKHIAIAVFINDAYANEAKLEDVIARIAKTVYDSEMTKKCK